MVGTSYTLLSNTSAHKHSCARSDKNGAKDLTTCRAGSLCTIFVFVFCLFGVVVFFFGRGDGKGLGGLAWFSCWFELFENDIIQQKSRVF